MWSHMKSEKHKTPEERVIWLNGSETITHGYPSAKFGSNEIFWRGAGTFLIYNLTKFGWKSRFTWLCAGQPLTLSHHCARFDAYRSFGCGI